MIPPFKVSERLAALTEPPTSAHGKSESEREGDGHPPNPGVPYFFFFFAAFFLAAIIVIPPFALELEDAWALRQDLGVTRS